MTDGGWRTVPGNIRMWMSSVNGLVAIAAVFTLIVGILLDSLVGRIVCGMIFCGAMVFAFAAWKKEQRGSGGAGVGGHEDVYSQSPEDTMKKLLFDDFQSSNPPVSSAFS